MSRPSPSPLQARLVWLALTGLAIAVILALIVGVIWGLGRVLDILSPVIWPLAFAAVLACLLNPLVDFFERKGAPRARAILLVFAMAVAIFVIILSSVVPQVVNESRLLGERIPGYAARVQQRVDHWLKHPPDWVRKVLVRTPASGDTNSAVVLTNQPTATNTTASTTNAPPAGETLPAELTVWDLLRGKVDFTAASKWLAAALPKVAAWLGGGVSRVAAFFGLLAGLLLVPVYTFYFLVEKRGIEKRWTDYLPVSNSALKDELVFVLGSISDCLVAFFRSQVLVAVCDGVLYTIGFLILGLDFAVLLGVMATVLTMIPFLGAIATCATALIISFAQYGDWQHPAGVLAVFAVVQTLEGFVIQPKIMGDRIGLHPLTVIIAIMVGTTLLGGILGGILAIPLTAAGRVLMFRYVWKRRDERAKV